MFFVFLQFNFKGFCRSKFWVIQRIWGFFGAPFLGCPQWPVSSHPSHFSFAALVALSDVGVFRGETCFMLPWMSCSKHGLDAWLFVGCFKSRRTVHCHFITSFVLFELIALLPACLILSEFRFLLWHTIEIFVEEVEANDVCLVNNSKKKKTPSQRCCRVVHCILTIFDMSTLPTVHSDLHRPGKVSSDWKVGRESSAAGVD